MLTVKEPMLSPDGTVAELDDPVADALAELDELEDELDELQAAAVSARAAARPAKPSRRKRRNAPPPCERERLPPSLLLPSVIPHTLSLNASNKTRRDTIHNRAPAVFCGIVRRDARNVPVNTCVKPLKKS
jgi:hypothetical protein